MNVIACCDIGGTKIRIGLVGQDGKVLASERYLIGGERSPQPLLDTMVSRFRSLAESSGLTWSQVAAVGCSATGPLDKDRQYISYAYNLWDDKDVPFKAMLEESCGVPAFLEMDGFAGALGEGWVGAGAGAHSLVYLIVGTGIGSGIVIEGKPARGWLGQAGEIGHTTLLPGGPACNCGKYGCLEALASGPAIALRARQALLQGRHSSLSAISDPNQITAADVIQAARQGDDLAKQVIAETAYYLGIGIATIITFLDPEVVILGGGVILGGADVLLEPIRKAVIPHCPEWVDLTKTLILPAALGEDAALLGVARLAWDGLID